MSESNRTLTVNVANPLTGCVEVVAGCVRITALSTLLLATGPVWAQSDEVVEPAAIPAIQPPLVYLEMPTAIEPEIDPVYPEEPAPINPEDDPEFIARLDTIRLYDEAVELIELQGGAWDAQLVEELSTLGSLQQAQGNHEAAIEIFDRAIHVNRIHSGLHTLEQIPTVEKMINSYLALGDWEKADLYYNYLFYIQQKAYGPHDPRIIPVLDRLASWNIQAFNIGYGESLGVRLSTAQILLHAAARMVTVHFGESDTRFVSYRRTIANSAYLVSRHPELMAATDRFEYRNAQDILLDQLDQQDMMRPLGFQAGETALREIVQYYSRQDDAQYELAAALADLGDWFLMFERRRAAQDLYTEAWQILERTDNAEELQQKLFGQVVPIPTFRDSVESLLTQSVTTSDGKTLHSEYVDMVFDVMPSGDARNIEILNEQNETNASQFSRLEREVRFSYFRPRIENGEPVRSDRNYFRYRYWY